MAAKPKLILVMRHAEKPQDPHDPNLTPAGQARAAKLATYIPKTFGDPDFLFAAAISKSSARPYETLEPLAKATGKPIDATIADNDYGVLASDLLSDPKYAGARVVVSWHHGNIPPLMHALGAEPGTYPHPWDREVFNLILRVKVSKQGLAIKSVFEPF
jgi:broad specificity phosphatase PhoE